VAAVAAIMAVMAIKKPNMLGGKEKEQLVAPTG
jgi:hypothetical protein